MSTLRSPRRPQDPEPVREGYLPRFSRQVWQPPTPLPDRPAPGDDVVARVVDPRGWAPLKKFSAGHSRRGAVSEVNRSARERHAGRPVAQAHAVEGPGYDRVVALLHADGSLVGWCGIARRHLCEEAVPLPPGAYIYAIATDRAYRGCRVRYQDRVMRPGSALMRAALAQIEGDWDGSMPYVWARVKEDNRVSHRLFDRHGFLSFPHPDLEWIRVRPAGLPRP